MINKLKLTLTALTLSLVVGCSSNPAALDRKALSANKVSVIDLTSPNKLLHEPSKRGSTASSVALGGLVGGIVGAGIDAAVNANRASTMAPIISALGDYNVRAIFANKLKNTSGNSVANNVTVNKSHTVITSAVNALNVKANFALLPNHQAVSVKASTALKTSEQAKVYKRNFSAVSNIDFEATGKEKFNATLFLKSNPQKLKQAIESAMDKVVTQISDDINLGVTPEAK